jgi:hypothetical protein
VLAHPGQIAEIAGHKPFIRFEGNLDPSREHGFGVGDTPA